MSSDTIVMGASWGESHRFMSAGTLAQIAENEAAEAAEARRQAQGAEQVQSMSRDDAFRASVALARELGQQVDMLEAVRNGGVGHTPREFLEIVSARQDQEDAVQAHRQRKEFERWQLQQSADSSGDSSADAEEQHRAEKAAERERLDRHYEGRARQHQRHVLIDQARQAARIDRAEDALRGGYR